MLFLFAGMGCGSKQSPVTSIVFSNLAPFSDSDVVDMVFEIQSLEVDGIILDQDDNNQADFFSYPIGCGASYPAQCGIDVSQSGNIELGPLPIGFRYQLTVKLRNASSTVLYQGQTTYTNSNANQTLSIGLQ